MVEGTFPARRGVLDLYDFVDDGDRVALLARGLLPWWTDPRLTIRFFRPLSSALLYLDHRLFSHAALPMHLHSLAWWAAAVLAARALFRRALPERPALLATAIFALSPCHALPLAWVANREALISLAFGALGVAAHARWVERRGVRDFATAAALFALALLGGGEYALSFGGYVLAMDLVRKGERPLSRVASWLPFLVPAALYLALRGALGYGSVGSGFYSDPLKAPGTFLANAPMRALSLVGSAWLTLDTEAWRSGVMRWLLLAIVLAGGFAMFHATRRALARLTAEQRRTATWLLLGSALALAPVLAVVPARRLLGTSMLGVAALVALVLDRAWFPTPDEEAEPKSRVAALGSLAAMALGFAHLVHGPGTSWLQARQHRNDGLDFATRVTFLRGAVGDPTSAQIAFVRGLAGDFFAPFALDPRGATPRRWTVLAQSGHVLALRRDERTLELVTPHGRGLYPIGERNLYRPADAPLRAGAEIAAPGMRVTVLEVEESGPRVVRFEFDDDPERLTWMTDDFDEMRPASLPKVGFGTPFDPRGTQSP